MDLLAEKVRIAEEEALLLSQKAAESEAEKQRIHIAAIKVSSASFSPHLDSAV